jgi:DNA-directed RNA polymerase subunit beta'
MVDIGGILRLSKRDGVRIATVIDSEVINEQHEIPIGWDVKVEDEQQIKQGDILVQSPDGDRGIVAKMDGTIHLEGHSIYIRYERRQEMEYDIPSSARLMPEVYDGAEVYPGQQLTEGAKNPHRILRILGEDATQLYLLTEVQKVYRNQGVNIADKHFEVMIRKMLSKVQLTKSGDSQMLPGELIDRLKLLNLNERLLADNKEPAAGVPILLGITKAALSTDSFLSASSFQHTIKVLAGAAIEGKVDNLYGLKENVIIGKLIPAGTGFHTYQDRELVAPNISLEAQGALDATDFDSMDEDDLDNIEDSLNINA